MKRVVCPRDYYNEQGLLLSAKGTKITLKQFLRLQRKYGFLSELEQIEKTQVNVEHPLTGEESYEKIKKQIYKLDERYKRADDQLLNRASVLLVNIVFESKKKPWYMYLTALGNHIDWLYTHSIDVALLSLMMAMESGVSQKLLWDLGLGGILHDVGKLLIPKRIIHKKTSLSDTEKDILRQHCELGVECTAECSLAMLSHDIILQHHERLDGSGYPNQLQEDQINEYVKIVMIADAFDTITAGRPYRKTVGVEEALAYLEGQNGAFSRKYLEILKKILI
ncbi:HD-GYP domain-containing protein [Desulfitobacterium sp. PCE1]|uniref:HD-GYP domain-containing protein n=1 Tax=Desulfitobacterium sp. PCE1 TaxID=146907 RepID=UPI000374A894|nr:HD domain-containing phosphohydrolase [Desulfitobacterium sp. PCE1]